MSYLVRRHKRKTASGKTTTVREHERQDPGGTGSSPYVRDGDDVYEVRGDGSRERLRPPDWWNAPASDDWGDDAWSQEAAEPEMSPAFAAMVRQNPALGGEDFRRLKALRDSGYDGPVDQDGNIPAPDDPRNKASLDALAGLREISTPAAKPSPREARERLRKARQELNAYRCDEEDETYLRLNQAVIDAERDVPWWQR